MPKLLRLTSSFTVPVGPQFKVPGCLFPRGSPVWAGERLMAQLGRPRRCLCLSLCLLCGLATNLGPGFCGLVQSELQNGLAALSAPLKDGGTVLRVQSARLPVWGSWMVVYLLGLVQLHPCCFSVRYGLPWAVSPAAWC